MVVSLAALFFCLMSFMTPKSAGNAHKLKSSNGPAEGNAEMQTMLSAVSAMLWGLVATKAKQGMAATNSSKSATVGSMMKSVSSLTMLVVMGSLFKFGAEVMYANPQVNAPATHKLQAAHESVTDGVWPPPEQFQQDHLDSFYDESSSHFMGGAANVALNNRLRSGKGESNPATFKGGKPSKAVKSKPSAYESLIKGRFEPIKKV